ncbi:allophanate hydrolase [Thalassolituus hydrocarboniclasticus]|uniref:Allophanate hydrolase n=1 Tax=Thalassolituus hydrocarboniclasticus TaxID=2742796 RepID=A0ABY6A5V7_9GAMM|nr:allophanate hydrolase [Thalassolituus hydrocarboniclasticus]UXD86058.1 allophanate hydrolase [Thalassolituus hydrocarboniclasticus]
MSDITSETSGKSLLGLSLNDWAKAYRNGGNASELLNALRAEVHQQESCNGVLKKGSVWIELASEQQLGAQLIQLQQLLDAADGDMQALPLYGVPFAVKDNIDVAGFATTAACPEFAYEPQADATVVRLLRNAGAIVLGKTNLDQFATGLVGTRSPYGAVANPFNEEYISGGSSSGSAVAVARGYVPFSLGTDTAGSGRIPAGFNHIVGLKASKGVLSTQGVVPACRSLDCVSVFALNTLDAERIFALAAQFDAQDAYSRPVGNPPLKTIRRLAVPAGMPWFGDDVQQAAFTAALANAESLGFELITIDFSPLSELAALLYQGPWVAERYAAVGEFIRQDLPGINPVVKSIIAGGNSGTAVQAFNAEYRRMELLREIQQLFQDFDALFVPTAPCFPTLAEVEAEPVKVNSQLGTYTNFVNLADLCAIALPADLRSDGLPFGITVIAPAFSENALLTFAGHWQAALRLPQAPVLLGARDDESVVVAVVGAHLTGMPLNHQLTSRNAVLLEQTLSAEKYQLYALANTVPPKPGLVRINDALLNSGSETGHKIIVELWRMDVAAFGSFVEEIPQPLGIGTLELADGRLVKGFICEPEAVASATHISEFGGWRAYIAYLKSQAGK